jgi:hypothetical protein
MDSASLSLIFLASDNLVMFDLMASKLFIFSGAEIKRA